MQIENTSQLFPSISVVTPSYNSLKFIRRLHYSLCGQSYKNFEWIVVDDCSTDSTISVLLEMNSPGRLGMKVFRLPHNTGGGVALGLAVKKSVGDIVIIIDHDDELIPEALMSIMNKWGLVSEDESLCGLLFPRIDELSGKNIGKSLETGMKFSMSWLNNSSLGISDAAIALKGQIAKKYFNPESCKYICLAGVPFINMTKKYRLAAAGGEGIVIYHKDNSDSQTNNVKISHKTVYTYAKQLDIFDRYYLMRPLYWIRHLIALIKFSTFVHKNPFYHNRYIASRIVKLLTFVLLPIGLARYLFSTNLKVITFTEFCLSDLDDLLNLKKGRF